MGLRLYKITKHNEYIILSEDIFTFTNNVDPDEMPHYFIWVFTACKRTGLGVSCIQRVKGSTILTQVNPKYKFASELQSVAKLIKIKYMSIIRKLYQPKNLNSDFN